MRKLFGLFGILLICALLAASALSASAAVYYVTVAGGGMGLGDNWGDAIAGANLKTKLAVANDGDIFYVAKGVYRPGAAQTDTFTLNKGVKIYGGLAGNEDPIVLDNRDFNINKTVLTGDINDNDINKDTFGVTTDVANIKGNNSYHVVTTSGFCDAATVIDGFVITAGDAGGAGVGQNNGGGMYNFNIQSPTVKNCTFRANRSEGDGSAMYNYNKSSPTVTNCVFQNNSSTNGSGTMYNNLKCSPTVTGCAIYTNSAQYGGGMYSTDQCSPELTDCVLWGNTVDGNGGGMFSGDNCSPKVTDCAFQNNHAGGVGGGIYNWDNSTSTLTDCTFEKNDANFGGGMANIKNSNSVVTNCTFSENSAAKNGGGMTNAVTSSPIITNCTFWGNSATVNGGGIDNSDTSLPTVTNCILWELDAKAPIFNDATSVPVVTYSVVRQGYAGAGNIADDPLLNPLKNNGGNTHTHKLNALSPAIGAGVDSKKIGGTEYVPTKDQCHNIRGSYIDIGAYQTQPAKYKITVIAGAGGSVNPGTCPVEHGTDKTFYISPKSGYDIDDVILDGVSQGNTGSVKLVNVTAAHTIEAKFKSGGGGGGGGGGTPASPEAPVASTDASADLSGSATPTDTGKFGDTAVDISGAPEMTGVSEQSELEAIGVTAGIKGGKLVLNGEPRATGTFTITCALSDGTTKRVKITINELEKSVGSLAEPTKSGTDWTVEYSGSREAPSFVMWLPVTVDSKEGFKEQPTVIFEGASGSASIVEGSGKGASAKWIKITGTVSDRTKAAVKSIKYRVGAVAYTQVMNVKLTDTKFTDRTTGETAGSSGGGCDAGFGLLALAAAGAVLRRR